MDPGPKIWALAQNLGPGPALGPKTFIFLRKIEVFYTPAPSRDPGGKDNLDPAEYVHNENPSLVALGKNIGVRTKKVPRFFVTFGPGLYRSGPRMLPK